MDSRTPKSWNYSDLIICKEVKATNTYDPETHTYRIDGVAVPSVTQIVDVITASERNAINPAVLAQAARRGTLVHEYTESIDYGIPLDEIEVEPALAGYVQAWLRFKRDWLFTPLHIEKPLYGEVGGYAGRIDRIGTIAGHLGIVDVKTTSSFDRLAKIALACQLQGYYGLCLENLMPPIDFLRGVQLKNNGTYTVHDRAKIEKKYKFSSVQTFADALRIKKVIGGYE